MARVLITAALGNVGREVVAECARHGLTVRAADRRPAAVGEKFSQHEAVRLDFLDHATFAAALAGCDFVFLLRPPPIGDMDRTLNPFIDAAYAAGVQHIVFLSVAGADRLRWVPHLKVERHLAAQRDAFTVLRPGFFAQNLQDAYLRDIVEDSRLYVPAGAGRVAFLDVRDAAEVAARVFLSPATFARKTLTLTGPEAVPFATVAKLLSAHLRRTISYTPASVAGYAWHLRTRRRMPLLQIAIQIVLHVGLRRGDAERVDPTVAELLGRPARSLDAYIEHAAEFFRAR